MAKDDLENPEAADDKEGEKKSGKLPLKWIILAIVLLLLIGGGVAGWFIYSSKSSPAAIENTEVPSEEAETGQNKESKDDSITGHSFPFESFVVNLNDRGGKRYLKVKIELEIAPGGNHDELKAKTAQLRDIILLLLSSKLLEDLQGIDGKISLRNELIMRINQVMKTTKVRNLYFTEFVIQ